ncbi:MAG: hypothetical protein HYZ42_04745 [Bacteroidetes bacterium]|nr:hypothetical protein [Bacteroidota bacterium]
MKRILILTAFSLLFICAAYTQNSKVESLRIAYLTKRLSLTPEEAKLFWPIYEQYKKETKDLRIKYQAVLKTEPEDMNGKSDAEAEKMLADMIAFKQAQVDLIKKFTNEFSKAISKKKIVLLYKDEEDFNRELIKKLQKNGTPQRPLIGDE